MILYLILRLLYIFKIVNYDSSGIGPHSYGATICAEGNGGEVFTLAEGYLLVGRHVGTAVDVYVYFFDFFALSDVVEVDATVTAAGRQ